MRPSDLIKPGDLVKFSSKEQEFYVDVGLRRGVARTPQAMRKITASASGVVTAERGRHVHVSWNFWIDPKSGPTKVVHLKEELEALWK